MDNPKFIYQLKITLKGSNPVIWRRFEVPSNITLDILSNVIMMVMGWQNCHLHAFTINNNRFEMITEGYDGLMENIYDECEYNLESFNLKKDSVFDYEYDFGDGWLHDIIVEKATACKNKYSYLFHPVCLEGENSCPPEDCGGIGGYYNFLQAIKNSDHDEHKNMINWIGGKFDEKHFNLEAINYALKYIYINSE